MAGVTIGAIVEGFFTSSENPEYTQGFATRKSFLFSFDPKGTFEFAIPFSHIFGFSTYPCILYGVQQKLTLLRTNDNMAIHRRNEVPAEKIELSNSKLLIMYNRIFRADRYVCCKTRSSNLFQCKIE